MKSKVVFLYISYYLFASVSANPAGNIEDIDTNIECQENEMFDVRVVDCSSDGMIVNFIQEGSIETELVVKGYLDDPDCGKNYTADVKNGTFFIKYGTCGVELKNQNAEFQMIVYRPPREIRKSAHIRQIKCHLPSKQEVATKEFMVEDPKLVTDLPSTSITVPDPTHELILVNSENEVINKAAGGEPITGKFCVKSKSHFASLKNCYFTPKTNETFEKYPIVGETGCPLDPYISQWSWNHKNHCVQLPFKAFKPVHWDEIHLFCDIHYCTQEENCKPPTCPNAAKPCLGQ